MKERGITDGLTMNQLAERNAEYVMTIVELEEKCAALSARLSMINDLMEAAEQANKLAQEATETLVQERNALAAENAGLKAAKEIIRHLNVNREEANFCGIDDCYIDDAVAAMITPATDAFLAEVRAQGVEMFAKHCQKRHGEMMKSEPNEAASNEAITATRRAGEFALYFAAQLRKGATL